MTTVHKGITHGGYPIKQYTTLVTNGDQKAIIFQKYLLVDLETACNLSEETTAICVRVFKDRCLMYEQYSIKPEVLSEILKDLEIN